MRNYIRRHIFCQECAVGTSRKKACCQGVLKAHLAKHLGRQGRVSAKQLVWAIREREHNCCGQAIQTDDGSEFEAEFAHSARLFCRQHRIARPYRKNEQLFIESFNCTVRKECLGWDKYRVDASSDLTNQVEAFLKRCHYHCPPLAFEPMRPPLIRSWNPNGYCQILTEILRSAAHFR